MNVLVINNIKKRKGKEIYSLIKKKFPAIQVINTFEKEDTKRIIDYVIKEKINHLICAGGDGTINWLVNELMKREKKYRKDISFGIIPTGKANDLAKKMGIPKNPEKAINLALSGEKKQIDAINVNKKYFLTGGGFGIPSEVIKEKEKKNNLSGLNGGIYFLIVLKIFLGGCDKLNNFIFLNKEYSDNLLISVMNQNFIGNCFTLSPNAKNNDGYLDVSIINRANSYFGNLFRLSLLLFKKHTNKKWVRFFHLKKLKIKFKEEETFMADGELLEKNKEFTFSIVTKAVSLIC